MYKMFLPLTWIMLATAPSGVQGQMRLELQQLLDAPVIGREHPDAKDNKYGFEGGSVIKIDGTYHMFVAELAGDPLWVRLRLAHWCSGDAVHWKRAATIKETSGKPRGQTGLPYESVWAPMPVYNDAEGRWDLFFVAYDQGGVTGGRIRRATSTVAGRAGIGGPYRDVGIVLQPDPQSQPWEGVQGVDSFFPYRANGRWYGFYGSSEFSPCCTPARRSNAASGRSAWFG
jgi:hypothetical protein